MIRASASAAVFLITVAVLIFEQPADRRLVAGLILIAALCGGVFAATVRFNSDHKKGWVAAGVICACLAAWVVVPFGSGRTTFPPDSSDEFRVVAGQLALSGNESTYRIKVAIHNSSPTEDLVRKLRLHITSADDFVCDGATRSKYSINDTLQVVGSQQQLEGSVKSKTRTDQGMEDDDLALPLVGQVSVFCGDYNFSFSFEPTLVLPSNQITVVEIRLPRQLKIKASTSRKTKSIDFPYPGSEDPGRKRWGTLTLTLYRSLNGNETLCVETRPNSLPKEC